MGRSGGGRVALLRDVDRCSGREGVISRWCENVEADARWTLGAVVDGRRPYSIGLVTDRGRAAAGGGDPGPQGPVDGAGLGMGADLVVLAEMIVRGCAFDWRVPAATAEPVDGPTEKQWSVLAAEVKRISWWVASASGTARPYTTRRWRSAPTG